MVDWSGIDTVLLDMDGTLLDLRYDNDFWFDHLPHNYAVRQAVPVEQARHKIQSHAKTLEGTIEFYCLDYWSDVLGLDVAAANEELAHLIQFRPYAEPFLRRLRQGRKQVILVTNSDPRGLGFKLARTGIECYLDSIVCAPETGVPKEDPRFWRALHARFGFDRSRTLLIDDNVNVLGMAGRFGVAHLLQVAQPDSSRAPVDNAHFALIHSFLEVLPVAG